MTKTYLLIDLQSRQPAPEYVSSRIGENGEAWIFYGEQEIGLLANTWNWATEFLSLTFPSPARARLISTWCSI
ncbi:hypothetical protein [Variovorax sp. 770b2]|uniref:hypothetical protein n=1 Tax=Variovorax sp. 770b2 TaxID=1566271 RepID=UPI001160826E|nr:hypothetical protein [Variovorax sp. 770b2]